MWRDKLLLPTIPALVFTAAVLIPMYIMVLGPLTVYWPFGDPCTTAIRGKISNLSGFDFETTSTECSAVAHWGWTSVFVSAAGDRKKTLLFKYDPAVDEMPVISVADRTHITIAVLRVSELIFQMHDWGDVHIEYQIGHVGPYDQPADWR